MKAEEIIKQLSELLGEFPLHITVVGGIIGDEPECFHIESEDDIREVIQTIGPRGAMTIDRPVGEVFTEKRGYYFDNGRYYKVPPDELRESYSYDSETGEPLDIPDNFVFC